MLSPAAYYHQQKELQNQLLEKATKDINRVAMLRLWVAVAAIIIGILAIRTQGAGGNWYYFFAAAVVFLVLVRFHQGLSQKRELLIIGLTMIENELRALDGDISPFADGAAYIDVAHPYSYDLDIFGRGSIYQMLCRTVTIGGAHQLAAKLSQLTLLKKNITDRQEVIRELSTMPGLIHDFRVAGAVEKEGINDQVRLTQWLQAEDHFINNNVIRLLIVLMPVISIAFLVYSFVIGSMFAGLTLAIVANWIILGVFQKKIKPAIAQVGNSEQFIDKFERLLKQVATHEFKGDWLQAMSMGAKDSLVQVSKFKALIRLLDSRDNVFIGPTMNSLFLFDLYCLLRLEAWRKKHKSSLLDAIDATIATDVYISCAVYAFNHPDNVYPTIAETGKEIKATDIRHPLLSLATAVGNDFSIGAKEQFYLLTGANMTGKSTFIRTIGVSNVLCNLGLSLPAKEIVMPLMELYTSMRITDSVQDDISYFRAELNRIKAIMDKVRTSKQAYIILLDEPLRGTNSTDKQQGTRSIVETLLTFHAIGIVATHDTGLCDMASTYPGKVSNYYFESKVEQNALSFDFKLKQGGATSNNATILMRQMGIIN